MTNICATHARLVVKRVNFIPRFVMIFSRISLRYVARRFRDFLNLSEIQKIQSPDRLTSSRAPGHEVAYLFNLSISPLFEPHKKYKRGTGKLIYHKFMYFLQSLFLLYAPFIIMHRVSQCACFRSLAPAIII